MIFGKNSDRQRNEAQVVEFVPGNEHPAGTALACTYRVIPQVARTHTILLSRPFWTWGAEIGANEHGVVIGNEALQAKVSAPRSPLLTGMDLVRLGLERAASAAEAVEVITSLLEMHGQGGDCGHLTPAFYNNGFIIADAEQAFVLETIGHEWLAERVVGTRALSNVYSIDLPTAGRSEGFDGMIEQAGWVTSYGLAAAIALPDREHLGFAKARSARATQLLQSIDGEIDARAMMRALRDHGTDPAWYPGAEGLTLCMHAGNHERVGQTTGSFVSELGKSQTVHWVTATAAPCLSIMKPILFDADLPDLGPQPNDHYDPATPWWRHEDFHRTVLGGDLGAFLQEFSPRRDTLEASFVDRIASVEQAPRAVRSAAVAKCWAEAGAFMQSCAAPSISARLKDVEYYETWATMDRIAQRSSWPIGPPSMMQLAARYDRMEA